MFQTINQISSFFVKYASQETSVCFGPIGPGPLQRKGHVRVNHPRNHQWRAGPVVIKKWCEKLKIIIFKMMRDIENDRFFF